MCTQYIGTRATSRSTVQVLYKSKAASVPSPLQMKWKYVLLDGDVVQKNRKHMVRCLPPPHHYRKNCKHMWCGASLPPPPCWKNRKHMVRHYPRAKRETPPPPHLPHAARSVRTPDARDAPRPPSYHTAHALSPRQYPRDFSPRISMPRAHLCPPRLPYSTPPRAFVYPHAPRETSVPLSTR